VTRWSGCHDSQTEGSKASLKEDAQQDAWRRTSPEQASK